MEEELSRQNALFHALMDNLQVGVFMVEAPGGRPLLANPKAQELLGRGILPDANRENLAEVYRALKAGTGTEYPPDEMPVLLAMEGRSSHVDDMLIERPDGSQVLLEVFGTPIFDENGKTVASLASFSDITERKTAETDLKKKNDLIIKLMETSPVGIVTLDGEGSISYANKRAEEILGLSKSSITSRPYNTPAWTISALDGGPYPEDQLPFNLVKSRGKAVFDIRHAINLPDGTRIALSIHASPIQGEEGRFEGIIATIENISQSLEQAILRELKDKQVLMKEIHHRVKNNISTISHLLSLQADSIGNPQARKILNEATSRVESMRQMYDMLLVSEEYSQISIKQYLEGLASSILDIFTGQSEVDLSLDIEDIPFDVKVVFPLGSIVNELMTNSLKYAFGEGAGGRMSLCLQKRENRIHLEYRDNGRGLPKGFDPEAGSGFGLMLIRMLVSQLEGSLKITGDEGFTASISFEAN